MTHPEGKLKKKSLYKYSFKMRAGKIPTLITRSHWNPSLAKLLQDTFITIYYFILYLISPVYLVYTIYSIFCIIGLPKV